MSRLWKGERSSVSYITWIIGLILLGCSAPDPIMSWEAAGMPPGTPGGKCIYISSTYVDEPADQLTLLVRTQDYDDIMLVSGGIIYDGDLIYMASWAPAAGWTMENIVLESEDGYVAFIAWKPDGVPYSKEILSLTFKALASGSTTVGWYNPRINDQVVAALGGRIHVVY